MSGGMLRHNAFLWFIVTGLLSAAGIWGIWFAVDSYGWWALLVGVLLSPLPITCIPFCIMSLIGLFRPNQLFKHAPFQGLDRGSW